MAGVPFLTEHSRSKCTSSEGNAVTAANGLRTFSCTCLTEPSELT
jgi:hypothetical protein